MLLNSEWSSFGGQRRVKSLKPCPFRTRARSLGLRVPRSLPCLMPPGRLPRSVGPVSLVQGSDKSICPKVLFRPPSKKGKGIVVEDSDLDAEVARLTYVPELERIAELVAAHRQVSFILCCFMNLSF